MGHLISQRAVLISGPWRPDDARPLSFIAAVFVTFCLFGWLLLLNFVQPLDELADGELAVVEVNLRSAEPEPEIEARDDDQPAGIAAVVQAPAAPLPPASVPPLRPVIPEAVFVFTPPIPSTDIPALDVEPLDTGRGITTIHGESRDGGANGIVGSGGGKGGNVGGSGSGNGSGNGADEEMRTDLTARWAPSMNRNPFPAVYPRKAHDEAIRGVAHLKCFAVRRNRVRKCSIVGESPSGYGFGLAALRAQDQYRVIVEDIEGNPVRNEWIIITIESYPKDVESSAVEP